MDERESAQNGGRQMSTKKEDWQKVMREHNQRLEGVTMTESVIDLSTLREFNQPKNIVTHVHFYVVEEHHRR